MTDSLRTTPLTALHEARGATMTAFAGHVTPLHFESMRSEAVWCRQHCSLFDVSHMGQILLRGGARAALCARLAAVDMSAVPEGRQRYSLLLADDGTIIDDCIIAVPPGEAAVLLVVNAARQAAVLSALAPLARAYAVEVELLPGRALLAVQGPEAARVVGACGLPTAGMTFMDIRTHNACWLARSGYTGEDGFEISLPMAAAAGADGLLARLLACPAVRPAGVAARDALRLEAGLCLYGQDITPEMTPLDADLMWTIPRSWLARRESPAAERLAGRLTAGQRRRRVGLRSSERTIIRPGAPLLLDDTRIGVVSSGGFSPNLGCPVAMGVVDEPADGSPLPGTARLTAEIRDRRVPVTPCPLPHVPRRCYRRPPPRDESADPTARETLS